MQSDEELIEHIRETAETLYHPVGTCKMGDDDMAVVDDRLRVRGSGAARRRRLGDADDHERQHGRADDDDRRAGGRFRSERYLIDAGQSFTSP